MKTAQEILLRLQKRQLYSFCGQVKRCGSVKESGNIKENGKISTADEIRSEILEMDEYLVVDDFFVNVTYIGVGKGQNPIDKVNHFANFTSLTIDYSHTFCQPG